MPHRLLAALLPVAFWSFAVSAQPADRDDPSIETLAVVGVADRWGEGGTVASLSADDIDRNGFAHPNELFASQPGTWISRGSGQEHLTAIRSPVLTGPGACGAFLILEDGIPIRPAGFCNVNNLFESMLEFAQGAEVLRGPAAAGFGGNALHGAINVKSASASDTPSGGAAQLEVGDWQYRSARLRWRQNTPGRQLQAGFLAAGEGGYRDQSGYALSKLQLRYQLPDSSLNLSAVNLQQETAGFIQGADAFRAPDPVRRRNANPEAYRDASALRFSYQKVGGQTIRNRLRLWLRNNDMDFLLHFLPCQPQERNNHSSLGGAWDWLSGAEASQLSWGLQLELADVHLDQHQRTPYQDCDVFGNIRFAQGAHYDYDVQSQNLAVRGSGRHQVSPASSVRLLWDVRIESLGYDYTSNLPPGPVQSTPQGCGERSCRYSRPASGIDRFNMSGARLAASFRPDGWQWHLALSSGYRPPQIGELYRLQEGQSKASLRPEQLLQLEWGGQWQNRRLTLDWAVYTARKTNHIYRDSARAIFPNGETSHLGAELSLRLSPAPAHELTASLSLADHHYEFNAVTFSSEQITAGGEIDTAPNDLAALVWNWRIAPTAQLQTEALHTGAYSTDAANAHSYGGHRLLNLRLALQPVPRLQLRFRIHNLLDAAYADRADYNALASSDRYFPGLPQTLYLAAEWSF